MVREQPMMFVGRSAEKECDDGASGSRGEALPSLAIVAEIHNSENTIYSSIAYRSVLCLN